MRPDDGPPQMELPDRLAAALPAPTRASFVHNDLKLDNCQFDPTDPDRVQSIFDWDMTTLGEPLVDLEFSSYWPTRGPSGRRTGQPRRTAGHGPPTRPEITEHYAARTGLDVSSAGWYEAFAQWKTGVVIQQLHNGCAARAGPRMVIADRLPNWPPLRMLDRLDGR